jgi:lipopolysaccharide biosynthesis protein
MKFNGPVKRLGIYFFHDRDGIVDEYVLLMLKDLKENCSKLILVCNGLLTLDSRKLVEQIGLMVLVRDDIGFNAWAYKEVFEYFGWDALAQFDEVALVDYTLFGPMYPLSLMFKEMDGRDLDFWGVICHNGSDFDRSHFDASSQMPLHIQDSFLVLRKHLIQSPEFKQYWQNLPMFNTKVDALKGFSTLFTRFFETKGFTWQVYIDTRDYKEGSSNPLLLAPLELIRDRRCPFISRNMFSVDYSYFLASNNGESTNEVIDYIKNNLNYDVDLIWANIIRLQNAADLVRSLHLTYILSSHIARPDPHPGLKVALVIHLFYEDMIDYCFNYARSMPPQTDIYISTSSEEKKRAILQVFSKLECNRLTVNVINNRGRDVSALLVAPKDYIMDYDLACFVHTKKSSHMSAITGISWCYKLFENLLASREFVENVISTFEQNPRLGILVTPHPSHGDYYATIGVGEWLGNYDNVKKLAQKLNLNVDIDPSKEPIAPLGSMFWFRPKALKKLYALDWDYSDFPEGNLATDGTIHHALERLHPFVAQDAGFYPAYVMSDDFASIENTNLYYMLRKLNRELFKDYGLNSHLGLLKTMEQRLNFGIKDGVVEKSARLNFKNKLKKLIPSPFLRLFRALRKSRLPLA